MLQPSQLFAFLAASALLTVSPGPDVLATISLGLSRGWRSAVSFGVGCGMGCLLHTASAVLGAATLLRTSPAAYTAMKLLGGGYLAWLGVNIIRSTIVAPVGNPTEKTEQPPTQTAVPKRDFLHGLLANATNPKVTIFFLSFLPSFVRPGNTPPQLQLALLGIVFTLQAVVIFAAIGFFSGQFGRLLHSFPRLPRCLDLLCGLLFLILAAFVLNSSLPVH